LQGISLNQSPKPAISADFGGFSYFVEVKIMLADGLRAAIR
jgi:hypothetical protein